MVVVCSFEKGTTGRSSRRCWSCSRVLVSVGQLVVVVVAAPAVGRPSVCYERIIFLARCCFVLPMLEWMIVIDFVNFVGKIGNVSIAVVSLLLSLGLVCYVLYDGLWQSSFVAGAVANHGVSYLSKFVR